MLVMCTQNQLNKSISFSDKFYSLASFSQFENLTKENLEFHIVEQKFA